MRIVVMGAGSVGGYITSILALEGHDVLVIEQDQEVLEYILSENDVMGVLGDGTNPELLREAEIEEADFFIALAADDEVNIVAANMAKVLGASHTIARVRSPKYEKNMEFMQMFMGVDHFLNPEQLAAHEVELTLGYSEASSVESFFGGRVHMIEYVIRDSSDFANKTLTEITSEGRLKNGLITIVDRDGEALIPNGDFKILPNDNIHVVGTPYDLHRIYREEFKNEYKINSVLIIGASRISYYLASSIIEKGLTVKVIELDKKEAVAFHNLLPDAIVIHGDGSNPILLEEENIESYDSIVALTGIDERNILIALLAEKAEIGKVITRVDNKDLLRITGVLDIDVTITPIKEAANHILRIIRSKVHAKSFAISGLYLLEDNQIEAIEFEVLKTSKIIGIPIKDLKIKDKTLIAFIFRKRSGTVIPVDGNTIIEYQDKVIVVTKQNGFTDIDDILEEE